MAVEVKTPAGFPSIAPESQRLAVESISAFMPAFKLVGTDLVQAVPLVLSAAISNILVNGLNWAIVIPLILGSVPGCMIGAKIAPRMRASYIRRGIVVALTMSGLALLDKAAWAPSLGAEDNQTHPKIIALVGVIMLFLIPLVWALLRRSVGLPMASLFLVRLQNDDSSR